MLVKHHLASDALRRFVELADELITLVCSVDSESTEAGFHELIMLTDALPLDTPTPLMAYLRNRIPSTLYLWRCGECLAARYQMREMHRKLYNLLQEQEFLAQAPMETRIPK